MKVGRFQVPLFRRIPLLLYIIFSLFKTTTTRENRKRGGTRKQRRGFGNKCKSGTWNHSFSMISMEVLLRHLQLESRNGVKYPACLYTPQDQHMGTTTTDKALVDCPVCRRMLK